MYNLNLTHFFPDSIFSTNLKLYFHPIYHNLICNWMILTWIVFLNCLSDHTTVCVHTVSYMLNNGTEHPTHCCCSFYSRIFKNIYFLFLSLLTLALILNKNKAFGGLAFGSFCLVVFYFSFSDLVKSCQIPSKNFSGFFFFTSFIHF